MAEPPRISVRAGQRSIPFSRGILSKSLTSTGVGVEDAYNLVEELEEEISGYEGGEISADELMNLTYRKLRKHGYTKAATNYLVWRNVRKLKVPIIILIGGATGVGKSTVSTEIAFRLGINYTISTDTIREVMRRMVSTELMPVLSVSSFDAASIIDIPYGIADKDIYAFESQVSRVSIGIKAVLERAVKENINIIMDGVHLVPGYHSVDYGDAITFHFMLSVKDPEQHKDHFYARDMASQRSAERYVRNLDRIRKIQDFIMDRAAGYDVHIINNTNLEETSGNILEVVTDRLKEEMEP
jgi:2-phosphoglycerate kinase